MPTNSLFDITLTANDGSNNIYISPDTSLNVMTLTFTNTSATGSTGFQQYTNGSYAIGQLGINSSAIYLLFNGLLSNTVIAGITFNMPGWTAILCNDAQNGNYWVLLPLSNVNIVTGDSVSCTIQFPAVTGSANGGYITAQYANVTAQGTKINGGEQLYVTLVYPAHTDGSAVAVPPLQFEIVGSNVVHRRNNVNDSTPSNTLSFRITNTSAQALIPGGTAALTTAPKFSIHFIQDNYNASGSLLSSSNVSSVQLSNLALYGNTLRLDYVSNSTPRTWTLTEETSNGTFLGTGVAASVTFDATGIKTDVAANTITMAVLQYSGFPGYEDGQLTAEISVQNPDPAITTFSVSPGTINITKLSTQQVTITARVSGATQLAVWQGLSAPLNITNPVDGNSYSTYATISATTAFVLIATNAAGKTVTRTLTVQVDTVPTGTIMMWSGRQGLIPSGWQICNGSGSFHVGNEIQYVPDLRSQFILGAWQDSYDQQNPSHHNVGQTGGGGSISHTVTLDPYQTGSTGNESSHTHTTNIVNSYKVKTDSSGVQIYANTDGSQTTDAAASHHHSITFPQLTGTTNSVTPDLPPFVALYYIIKTS